MHRLTIARFDVVRTANIVAALYAVIVLVIVLLFAVPFAFVALLAGPETAGADIVAGGVVGGLLVLVLAVVFYGGIGWVMTALVCALYNALAGRIGGIRIEVQPEGPAMVGPGGPGWPAPAPAPAPIASGPAQTPITGGPPQPPTGWGSQR
jgi:hypothetical protein